MYLFFIVYEEVLDEEVLALLEELKIDRYIKWVKVKGEWREKHMGSHVWPGQYNTVLAMTNEEEVAQLKTKIENLKKEFSADEIWGWTVPLERVV